MIGGDPVTYAVMQNDAREKARQAREDREKQSDVALALSRIIAGKRGADEPGGDMEGMGDLAGMGMKQLGGMFGGGGGGGGAGSFGGLGFGGSPWDLAFTGLGSMHGAIQGNDPTSPMVPGNRRPHGSDKTLIGIGAPIGGAIGSMFGFGGAGALAGQNVGATISDIANGDIHNLGLDVSQNLPPIPGMRQPGWKGLLNGATGLPFGTLLGAIFK